MNISYLIEAKQILGNDLLFENAKFFNILAGNSVFIEQLKSGKTETEIRATWKHGLDNFKTLRDKYLLYK